MDKLALFIFIALLAIGCERTPRPIPIFTNGACVEMRLDGKHGMIVRRSYDSFYKETVYRIRVATDSVITDSRWGEDGPMDVKPYTTLWVREFELKHCE